MTIVTVHSVYTFKDCGDGAFEMTSTNARYPGPYLMRFVDEPLVGQPATLIGLDPHWLRERKKYLVTSPVMEITHEDSSIHQEAPSQGG